MSVFASEHPTEGTSTGVSGAWVRVSDTYAQRVWGMGSSLHSLMSIVAGRGRRARADGLYALVSVLS